jgi:hypothetical protein
MFKNQYFTLYSNSIPNSVGYNQNVVRAETSSGNSFPPVGFDFHLVQELWGLN